MDQLNFNNMLLAYHAVHDDVLCESMDELGFFDDGYQYDEIEEGYRKLNVGKMMRQAARKPVKAAQRYEDAHFGYGAPRKMNTVAGEPNWLVQRALKQAAKMARVASRHSEVRSRGQEELNRRRGGMKEDYDLFDLVLEHLIDEGYADSLESAEAIIENMSDEWLETIFEAEGSYGQTPKAHERYSNRARQLKDSKRNRRKADILARHARRTDPRSKPPGYRRGMTPDDRTYWRGAAENDSHYYEPEEHDEPRGPGGMPRGRKLRRQRKTGLMT
jgi:hypothetical protein